MGEEIKLFCSEKCSSTNGKDLKCIFVNRFKLPDGFWNDLLYTSCPQGLGKVNEKLRNGQNLSASDFKSLDKASSSNEAGYGKNKQNVFEIKTPELRKCISNATHSPSLLISSVSQDCEFEKGPKSSTPLPWKLVKRATLATTPKTITINALHNDSRTPKNDLPCNRRTKTSKLSASLTVDPLEQMNLSWSSSLATPPASPQPHSVSTEKFHDVSNGMCSFEISEIPLEKLNITEREDKFKIKPKGVARTLFKKEIKNSKTDDQTSTDYFLENTSNNDKDTDLSTISKCSDLASSATMSESNALTETHKSPAGVKTISNLIEKTLKSIEEIPTHEGARDQVVHDLPDLAEQFSHCVKVCSNEDCEMDPDSHSTAYMSENTNNSKDFKNLYDMDALSELPSDFDWTERVTFTIKKGKNLCDMEAFGEFPVDVDLPERVTTTMTSHEGGNLHPNPHNININKEDQVLCTKNLKTDENTAIKNSFESLHTEVLKNNELLNNEVSESEEISRKTTNCVEPSAHISSNLSEVIGNEYLNTKKPTSDCNRACIVTFGKNDTSTTKVETASQVVQSLSSMQFSEIIYNDQRMPREESNFEICQSSDYTKNHELSDDKEVEQTLTVRTAEISGKEALVSGMSWKPNTKHLTDANSVVKLDINSKLTACNLSIPLEDKAHDACNSVNMEVQNEKCKITNSSDESGRIDSDCQNVNTMNENITNTKDFKNLYDMDALSEFPFDYDLSEPVTAAITYEDANLQPIPEIFESIKNDQGLSTNSGELLKSDENTAMKNGTESLNIKVLKSNQLLNNEISKCEKSSNKLINYVDASVGREYLNLNMNKPTLDCEHNLCKITNSSDVSKCQNQPLNPFVGFSTASGKKVKFSEKSMRKAKQLLIEIDKEEEAGRMINEGISVDNVVKNYFESNNKVSCKTDQKQKLQYDKSNVSFPTVVLEKAVGEEKRSLEVQSIGGNTCNGDTKMKSVDNKPPGKTISNGFSTASGKKVEVSMKSLKRAKQILDKVIQEESGGSQKNCEVPVPKIVSKDRRDDFMERDRFESLDKQKQDTGMAFSTESLFEASSIVNEVNKIGKFSYKNDENVHTDIGGLDDIKYIINGDIKDTKTFLKSNNTNCGFSSAAGKKVLTSEESFGKRTTHCDYGGKQPLTIPDDNLSKCQKDKDISVIAESRDENDRNPMEIKLNTLSTNSVEKAFPEGKQMVTNPRSIHNDSDEPNATNSNASDNVVTTATGNRAIALEKHRDVTSKTHKKVETSNTIEVSSVNNLINKKEKYEPLKKNETSGFTTASGNKVTVSEASLKKAKAILNDIENEERSSSKKQNWFSTASENKIVVSEESWKKAQNILNEVAEEEHPVLPESASSKNIGFTPASGNNVTVSEASLQKTKIIFDQLENEECSKKGKVFSRSSKFGFCTASGNEISVSEESLKKARKILNGVDSDEQQSAEKVNNKKPLTCFPTVAPREENTGFTTASGNAVTVSEASIQIAKGIFNDIENEECPNHEEKPSSKVKSVRFSAASGNEIVVSDISLAKAPRTLNEVDNEEYHLKNKVEKQEIATRKRSNYSEDKKILNNSGCENSRECARFDVERSLTIQKDIPRLEKSATSKPILEFENYIETRRKQKRLSSEIEADDDRVCKTLRTDNETDKDGRRWMKPDRSDPLAEYNDRKYSKFRSPLRAVVVSPDFQYTIKQTSDQPPDIECKQTPINSKSKSSSHFLTPYRAVTEFTVKQGNIKLSGNRTNISSNSDSKSGKKRTRNTKQENKAQSVKPQPGSIYKLRNNACFHLKRISFSDYVHNVNRRWTSDELVKSGISPAVLSITCENADSYRFKGSDFLSENACATNSGVRFTEGAILSLGEDKCVGLPEFTKAFLSSPGVDPTLINKQWIANHYKWIVWKLASYEVSYPELFFGRSLTPDMVLRQLKYRYDREIDHCERSAIKKILERDDNSSRSMVLCVARVNAMESIDENNDSKSNRQCKILESQKIILMTDGWYSVHVQLDEYLQCLVKEKKIYVGQKLFIQGAELIGSDQAVSPLEAPDNLYLRIHGNSTRPAKRFSRLGFHRKNNIFTVPIKSISSTGGLVSSINVVVARQYPLQFMEKLPDGSCVFRNPRCEERIAKKFEEDIQRKREKILFQVQTEIDDEEIKTTRRIKRRKSNSLSTNVIQNLSDGKEMFDAISNATDPFSVENCLSVEQRRILDNYKENLHNDRADSLRRKYDEAWRKLCEEETLERNVVPVLKVKLIDCLPSKSNQTPGIALLTVWRPTEQIITTLGEGERLKIYNLHASRYTKGNISVQLSANRCTIYKVVQSNSASLDTFLPRKVYNLREISNGLKPNMEVDVVAVVVSQLCQPNLTVVYVADSDLNFVQIKIWGGLEDKGLQDVMKEKNFIAACNLLSQPGRRFGIPSLKYYELSLVTSNPSNKILRNSLIELRRVVTNTDSFIRKAKAKLDESCKNISNWSSPNAQSTSVPNHISAASSKSAAKRQRATQTASVQIKEAKEQVASVNGPLSSNASTPSPSAITTTQRKSESILQSRKRLLYLKRKKLDLIPNPPPLSRIPNALSTNVKKEFKVPRRVRTQSIDDIENEEE